MDIVEYGTMASRTVFEAPGTEINQLKAFLDNDIINQTRQLETIIKWITNEEGGREGGRRERRDQRGAAGEIEDSRSRRRVDGFDNGPDTGIRHFLVAF